MYIRSINKSRTNTAFTKAWRQKIEYVYHDRSPRQSEGDNRQERKCHQPPRFMPFGEELNAGTPNRAESSKYALTGDGLRKKFTGYEKDTETGLDFAEARYYNNQHGRFTAVDPLLASGKSANPQTFNRYVYVGNKPLAVTDPKGFTWFYDGNNKYRWFDSDPGEGWNRVSDFIYQGEGDHGWVALDPFSSNWKDKYESKDAAGLKYSLNIAIWNANNFLAAAGDAADPIGFNSVLRRPILQTFNLDDNINEKSGFYRGGWWTGFGSGIIASAGAAGIAEGVGAGAKEGAKQGFKSFLTKFKAQQALKEEGAHLTRSTLQLGQQIHKKYKVVEEAAGIGKANFRLPSGRRIDFLDTTNGIIFELNRLIPGK